MLTRFDDMFTADFNDVFRWLDSVRKQMDRVSEGRTSAYQPDFFSDSGPSTNLLDNGNELLVVSEVPGMSEKDINVSLNQDILTISGERKIEVPKGYEVLRRERADVKFSRSFKLPSKVDPEKAKATFKDGILTVQIAKAPEAQPRKITVKAT